MAGIDLLVNPHAGRLRRRGGGPSASRRDLRRALLEAAGRHGARVHEPETLAELDDVARLLCHRGARVVVVAGGDGSLMRALCALDAAFAPAPLPSVGIVPAGTVGTVARNLGLHRATADAVLEAAARRTPNLAPHATLRALDGSGARRVGFIFGTGLVSRFFDVYHRSRRPGLVTAASIAARVFAGSVVGARFASQVLSPTSCALTVDGVAQEGRAWTLVVASVLRDVGLHFHVTYRAGEDERRFHVVASRLSPSALGPQMPRVLVGRPLRGEAGVDALAGRLDVRFTPPPGAYVLDGDVFESTSVSVERGPVVSFLVPTASPTP